MLFGRFHNNFENFYLNAQNRVTMRFLPTKQLSISYEKLVFVGILCRSFLGGGWLYQQEIAGTHSSFQRTISFLFSRTRKFKRVADYFCRDSMSRSFYSFHADFIQPPTVGTATLHASYFANSNNAVLLTAVFLAIQVMKIFQQTVFLHIFLVYLEKFLSFLVK